MAQAVGIFTKPGALSRNQVSAHNFRAVQLLLGHTPKDLSL